MKPTLLLSLLLVALGACSGARSGVTSMPGAGAVNIAIVPNPIVATRASGNTYDFPFEVVVRETGGRPITVSRVSAEVFAPGGISLGRETWDADRIRSMGYGVTVNPNGELRYRFNPRKEVPDDRLFGSVRAELKVEAVDDQSTATSAATVVTITRG